MDKTDGLAKYESFLEVVKARRTCRNFAPDDIPDGYIEKILEAARWAPSGANSQPWSFIVVRDSDKRKKLFDAYCEINMDFVWWMEQMRSFEYRHPGYQVRADDPDEGLRIKQTRPLWRDAPVIIALAGDGRKQWGTVLGAHTFSLNQSHLTDSLANAATIIHLAAASLGLTSQWVSIHIQDPFKDILGVPAPLMIHTLIPIGYPKTAQGKGYREPLESFVHHEEYDMSRHLNNKQIIERLYKLRSSTGITYESMIK